MTIYRGDFELNETKIGPDVSCPECGVGYAIDDYPEEARAKCSFVCNECGYTLDVTMHLYPAFTIAYKYQQGKDPKELNCETD